MDLPAGARVRGDGGLRDRPLRRDPPPNAEARPAPRIACVRVPDLPLQLFLLAGEAGASGPKRDAGATAAARRHPVAVVDRDRPQGRILWADEIARRSGIVPGMAYAAALSLRGDLRAGEVAERDIEAARARILDRLLAFAPGVEPCPEDPGVFWLNARGLGRLHPSFERWAGEIRSELLRSERLESAVVVGFTRFGTYAVARSWRRGEKPGRGARPVTVFRDAAEEDLAARAVPLDRLPLRPRARSGGGSRDRPARRSDAGGLDPGDREVLEKLGVETVGDFADLPPEGVERRFGKEARWLHALARGEIRPPLAPALPEPPLRERTFFESGETEASRLAEAAREMLGRILTRLAARGRALAALEVDLGLEDRTHLVERLRPAAPTLDAARLGELIALRLGALKLPDRVGGLEIRAEGRPAAPEQLELFSLPHSPPRDLDAADRALARIRAQFRDSAVVRARLEAAHLPEAQFVWEPLKGIPRSPARPRAEGGGRGADEPGAPPGPAGGEPRRLVRRIYDPPLLLAPRPRHEPDGWIVRSLERGSVVRLAGPYVVSSGWWREAAHREYHFAETAKGEVLWLYYDRLRRRWFLQGRVE